MVSRIGSLLDTLLAGRAPRSARVLRAPYPSFIEPEAKPVYTAVTRAYNMLGAAVGLLLLSPLLLVLATAVKLTSPGPVLYRGKRVGKGRRVYDILKFRTMAVGAEQAIGKRLVRRGEDHITKLGRFLRKYRLDELPQLINVLKGDMNLVGPRPIRPIFLDELQSTIPAYGKRFSVRPGITGQAQVHGGYYTSPRDKLRYEMLYIAHRSVLLDLKLITLTFLRVMTRMFTAAVVLAWLIAALLIVPRQALALFVVDLGPFSFNVLYLLPAFAVAWLLIRKEVTDGRLYFLSTPVDLPCGLFVAMSMVSVAFSHNPMISFRGALYYLITGVTVFYLVLNTSVVTAQWRNATRLLAGLGVLVALIGLLELVSAWHFGPGLLREGSLYRIRSTLGNTLGLASFLVLAFPFALALFLRESRPLRRALWGLASIATLATVFLTFTRTALAGSFVAMWLFLRERHRRLLIVLGAIIAVVVFALSATGDRRFDPGVALRRAGQELQRQGELLTSFSGKRLMVGVGARTLPSFAAAQAQREGQPSPAAGASQFSNSFLTVLVEHGVLGFLLLALVVTVALERMRRASESIEDEDARLVVRAAYAGLAGFLVVNTAFDGLRILPLGVVFWSVLGFGLGLALHQGERPAEYYRVVHFRDRL